MPFVIPLVIGAGLIGLGSAGITIGVFTAMDLILFGSSLVLSGVSSLLRKHPSTSNSAGAGTKGSPITVRNAVAPWDIVYGRAHKGGTITYISTTGASNEKLNLVITIAGHQINDIFNVYFDGWRLDLNVNGDCVGSWDPNGVHGTKYSGLAHFEWNLGTATQSAFAGLVAADPAWTSSCKQSGRAGAFCQLTWDSATYTNGVPNITFDVHGALVYDPRNSTTAYSENVALCLRDFLTNSAYGLGCPTSQINDSAVIAAANHCDELVNLAAGGTETRYTCNGYFPSSQRLADTISAILSAMAGYCVWTGGQWNMYAGVWTGPAGGAYVLTDDDLIDSMKVTTRLSKRDLCNAIKGTYINPSNKWQPSDFPAYMEDTTHGFGSDQWLTEDQGERIYLDIQLPFTISGSMAQRLAKIQLERTRRQIQIQGRYKLTAFQYQPPDIVPITHARFGWSSKNFKMVNCALSPKQEGDSFSIGVDAAFREEDSGIYAWSTVEELSVAGAPQVKLPDVTSVIGPTSVALQSDWTTALQTSANTWQTMIKVTWTPSADTFVQNGGQYVLQYSVHGSGIWLPAGKVAGAASSTSIMATAGTQYDVQIWAVNAAGAASSIVQVGPITAAGGVVVGQSFGKNLLSNPGFELNQQGLPSDVNVTLGNDVCTDWVYDSSSDSTHFTVQWSSSDTIPKFGGGTITINPHGGSKSLLIRLANGLTVPSGARYLCKVHSKARIPISPGDVVKISGYANWLADQTVTSFPTVPGGFVMGMRISMLILDANGNVLGDAVYVTGGLPSQGAPYSSFPTYPNFKSDIENVFNDGQTLLTYAIQIPFTYNGGTPAYVQAYCLGYVDNNAATSATLPSNQIGDFVFDDISISIQLTSQDQGAAGTFYVPDSSSSPLSAAVPGSSTTGVISIASNVVRFADAGVTYNSGSISGLNAGQTYDVYADNPTFLGGAVTYVATQNVKDLTSVNGRVYFGRITIPNVGDAAGTVGYHGGSGSWLSPGRQKQIFTASGTFTIPPGINQAKATIIGAGGSGGGGTTGGQNGYGGGSGGCSIKYLTGLTPGNTITVTVGTGGVGTSGGSGGSGGSSSISSGTQSITTVTANGGGGGGPGNGVGPGASPGSGGDVNYGGSPGTPDNSAGNSGSGAPSIYGGGGNPTGASNVNGNAGQAPGAGGSGGHGGASNTTGGSGANGIVIFEWS